MKRRTVLAVAAGTLGGCLAPAQPPTDRYPSTPPNVLAAFDYRPDGPAYEVRFVRGNRLTSANTGTLEVRGERAEPVVWASGSRDSAVEAFPVEPGDSLRYPVGGRQTVRLVWNAPDGDRSVLLAETDPETETER